MVGILLSFWVPAYFQGLCYFQGGYISKFKVFYSWRELGQSMLLSLKVHRWRHHLFLLFSTTVLALVSRMTPDIVIYCNRLLKENTRIRPGKRPHSSPENTLWKRINIYNLIQFLGSMFIFGCICWMNTLISKYLQAWRWGVIGVTWQNDPKQLCGREAGKRQRCWKDAWHKALHPAISFPNKPLPPTSTSLFSLRNDSMPPNQNM